MLTIHDDFLPIYAKFFSRSVILEFLYKREPKHITSTIKNSNAIAPDKAAKIQYKELFDMVYQQISTRYPCEYVYKNVALFHEILSTKHNDDAKLLTEVAVGNSKADIVVVNGTTTVYEIKTELDTLRRLENQLEDYIRVFDRINVLTCKNKLNGILEILNSRLEFAVIGICIFEETASGIEIVTYKDSQSNLNNIDNLSVYDTINYSEFRKYYPEIVKEDFVSFAKVETHKIFSDIIRTRAKDQDFLQHMPDSLKMVGSVMQKLSRKDKSKLIQKLENYVVV